MGPVAPPYPGPRPSLTTGVGPQAVLRGEDQGTGGGHRPSRPVCEVGHSGTCGDAQGRGQRVGGGAAARRTGFRGARHCPEGGRRPQLHVALGKEGDRVRQGGLARGLSPSLLLGRGRGHHQGLSPRRWPGAWLGTWRGWVHSDIADEDRERHGGFRRLQGDLRGAGGEGPDHQAPSPPPPPRRPPAPAPAGSSRRG